MCTLYICVLGASVHSVIFLRHQTRATQSSVLGYVMVRRAFASFAGCQDLPGIASYANAKLQDLQISTRPVS